MVSPQATAYVIDPTCSGAVAEAVLGLDYEGTMIHDGWSPYDRFGNARHQQCLNHLLRRADEMAATVSNGARRQQVPILRDEARAAETNFEKSLDSLKPAKAS